MGKALQAYRRYRELADRGEFRRVGEVLDKNWIENCLGLTRWTLGLDIALANLQAGFGQAFSGLQVAEHEVVEDGDALVIRGQNSAVHTGRFLGIEPTGRRVSWEYLDMYRADADGRLNWHFLATDWNLVRLQLLGQAPDLPITPTRRAVQAAQDRRGNVAESPDRRQCAQRMVEGQFTERDRKRTSAAAAADTSPSPAIPAGTSGASPGSTSRRLPARGPAAGSPAPRTTRRRRPPPTAGPV